MKRKMPPVHPGAILREDVLKEMNLSVTDAALGLQISRKQLSKITHEAASITAEMAVRLENGFKIPAEFWLDLQKKYDIWKVQESGLVKNIHLFAPRQLTNKTKKASVKNLRQSAFGALEKL